MLPVRKVLSNPIAAPVLGRIRVVGKNALPLRRTSGERKAAKGQFSTALRPQDVEKCIRRTGR